MDRLKSFILLLILFLSIAAGIAGYAFFIEPRMIIVKRQTIKLPGWIKTEKPLKIAVLSDFHLGFGVMDEKRIKNIIDLTNQNKPDIVFLLGDYLDNSSETQYYLNILDEFKKIESKLGIYSVMGNHEGWYFKRKIEKKFSQLNIKVLENRAEKITFQGKTFWVAGIEDFRTGNPDLKKTTAGIKDKSPIILLSHNPDIFYQTDSFINLVISGHTHGGQVGVPLLGKLVVPSRFGREFLKGYIIQENRRLFITGGLGTTILPIRFLSPPEINILEIISK